MQVSVLQHDACIRVTLTQNTLCYDDAHLGVWGSRGGGGRGGAKMAVRVLHLRKLAKLHKVHNVQGIKTPQGDCHHPTEYLLQHTGLLDHKLQLNSGCRQLMTSTDSHLPRSTPLRPRSSPTQVPSPFFFPLHLFPAAVHRPFWALVF